MMLIGKILECDIESYTEKKKNAFPYKMCLDFLKDSFMISRFVSQQNPTEHIVRHIQGVRAPGPPSLELCFGYAWMMLIGKILE